MLNDFKSLLLFKSFLRFFDSHIYSQLVIKNILYHNHNRATFFIYQKHQLEF